MSKQIRIGVAGAGVFGAHHAGKYAIHENARLTGVFDTDDLRAERLSGRFGVRRFDDYSDMLETVDAVVVAAPAIAHYQLTRRALERGRHVFVEKPIALTPGEADALIALADAQNLILQVGHQERYVFAAAGLFERDCAPVKIDCIRCAAPSGRCEDVSVVFDLMVHDLDLVRRLTKSELTAVAAVGDAHEASADITLSNGSTASFKASRRAARLERRMTLVFEDGEIEFDFVRREIANSTPTELRAGFSQTNAPKAFSDPLGYGADQFIAAIRSGERPIVSGGDGRIAVDWASKIEQAASISVDSMRDARERLSA